MPNLTSVGISSGVPNSGTGTVSTIDALMADGGQATIGAKADAKSTATDTTAVTAMSVWKQISASVQAIATALGAAVFSRGSGASDSSTMRVTIDTGQLAAAATTAQAMSAGFQVVDPPTDGTFATRTGSLTETAPATDTASSGLNGRLQRIAQRLSSMFTTGLSNKAFVATFTTLTRPANQTAYTALDSISDNATAGSVTALTATTSDTNDDPIFLSDILVTSTDTGLAGKRVRAYLFNGNPTSNTGVGGGDNAAYSQKVAGYIGSFSGVLETGFSDGTVGRLVPTYADGAAASTPHAMAGGFVVALPTSGARTLFIQFQAVDGFTPSANSTTIIAKARGWQGRAA